MRHGEREKGRQAARVVEGPHPAQALLHDRHEPRAKGVGQRCAFDDARAEGAEEGQDPDGEHAKQPENRERTRSARQPSGLRRQHHQDRCADQHERDRIGDAFR